MAVTGLAGWGLKAKSKFQIGLAEAESSRLPEVDIVVAFRVWPPAHPFFFSIVVESSRIDCASKDLCYYRFCRVLV